MYTDVNVLCKVGCFLAGIQRREISRLHLCRSLYTMKVRTEKSHWNRYDIHKVMLKLINWKWIFCYWLRGMIKLNPHSQYNLAKYFVGDIYSARIIDVAIVWDRRNICHKNYKCCSLKGKRHDVFPVRRGMQLGGPLLISASLICQVLFLPLFSLQTLWHLFILIETHSMGLCM